VARTPRADAAAPDRQPRARLDRAERRDLIIDAARRVFLDCGFAGARTQRIAREADVTEALLYRHFPSKEALFEAAVLEPLEAMVNDLAERANRLSDATDRAGRRRDFAAMHRSVLSTCVEVVPLLGIALFSEGGKDFYRSRLMPLLDRAADSASELLATWPLRRPLDGHTAFTMTVGMYLGLALDAHMRGEVLDVDALAETLADIVVRGVSASGRRT
jgi:TetR/AcrR family transcriptional regulator